MLLTQENTFSGTVIQYLQNPEGEVDGLLLSDGTQVDFPPHVGLELTSIVQPGTSVTVQGRREGNSVVVAFSVTNQTTGQTVVDMGTAPHLGPLGPGRHPAPPPPPPRPGVPPSPHLVAPPPGPAMMPPLYLAAPPLPPAARLPQPPLPPHHRRATACI